MEHLIEAIQQKKIPTLSVHRRSAVSDLPSVLGQAYGEIMAYTAKRGAKVSGPAFVIYYNMNMEDLDIEIGFVCEQAITGGGTVIGGEIKAGTYVSAVHYGPYGEMVPLYEAMNIFIQENGLSPTGVAIEFYYNSPMEVPESELKTKIWLQVQ